MHAKNMKLVFFVVGAIGLAATVGGNRVPAVRERGLQETEKKSKKDEECHCEEYLQSKYLWDRVEEILEFPNFCCVLSVLAYHTFYYGSKKAGQFDSSMSDRYMDETTAADAFVESFLSLAAESNNVTEAEIAEQIESAFAEDSEEEKKAKYGKYGGEDSCRGMYGIYKLKCLLTKRLSEGVDACYCHYRGNQQCDYKSDCDIDTNMDVYRAHDDYAACFSCPSGKKKHDWRQRALATESKHDYDLSGKPYNDCLGYCFLFGTYHHPGW